MIQKRKEETRRHDSHHGCAWDFGVGPGALKLDFSSKSRFMALKCAKMLLHDSREVFGDPHWHLDDGLSVFAGKMVISAMKRKTEP